MGTRSRHARNVRPSIDQLVDQFEFQARLLLKQNLPENTRHALLSLSLLRFSLFPSPPMRARPPMMDSTFFSVELNCNPCLHMLHPRTREVGCWVSHPWQPVALWWCGDTSVGGWVRVEEGEGLKVSSSTPLDFSFPPRLWLVHPAILLLSKDNFHH